jgi:hypothetical protein
LCSCTHSHTKNEIEAAMRKYDSLLQTMDGGKISGIFTTDGEFEDVAKGRDSIKKFFSSFTRGKVIFFKSYTKEIELSADSAVQNGTYTISGIKNLDTSTTKGKFTVKWRWFPQLGWKIKKITMRPI